VTQPAIKKAMLPKMISRKLGFDWMIVSDSTWKMLFRIIIAPPSPNRNKKINPPR
jgi:hypothetical protein